MPLNLGVSYATGYSLSYSIQKNQASGAGPFYDNSTNLFSATPVTPLAILPEGTGNLQGSFNVNLPSTPVAVFTNGNYVARIHSSGLNYQTVAQIGFKMYNGDEVDILPLDFGQNVPNSGVSPSGTKTLLDVMNASFIGCGGEIYQSGTVLLMIQNDGTIWKTLSLDNAANPQHRF